MKLLFTRRLAGYSLLESNPAYSVSVNGNVILQSKSSSATRVYGFYVLGIKTVPPPIPAEVNGKPEVFLPDTQTKTVTISLSSPATVKIIPTREEIGLDSVEAVATLSIPEQVVEWKEDVCRQGGYDVVLRVGSYETHITANVTCEAIKVVEQPTLPEKIHIDAVVEGIFQSVPYDQYVWVYAEALQALVVDDSLYNSYHDPALKKGSVINSCPKSAPCFDSGPMLVGKRTYAGNEYVTVSGDLDLTSFIVGIHQVHYRQYFPGGGYVEYPVSIYRSDIPQYDVIDKHVLPCKLRIYYMFGYKEAEYGADVPIGCSDFKSLSVTPADVFKLTKVSNCAWDIEFINKPIERIVGYINRLHLPSVTLTIKLTGLQWSDFRNTETITIDYDVLRTSDPAIDSKLSSASVQLNGKLASRTGTIAFSV